MTATDQENTPAPSGQLIGCFKILLAFFSLGPVLLFVATQLGRYSFLCELISNFQLFIFLSLIPSPVILYFLGMKRWAGVISLPLLWSFIVVSWVHLPANTPQAGDTTVRMMSFNVYANNPNRDAVLDLIEENDPDVLLVVECSHDWIGPLSVLKKKYPYEVTAPRWHGFGIALFSKFPINRNRVVQLAQKKSVAPALIAHLQVGDQELRVVGIHVVSPRNLERLRTRNEQFADISKHLSSSNEPTILIGDFNCTTWSPYLQDLMKATRLTDSRQGFGYLPSWNAQHWPFRIPIDHALVSEHIHVRDRRVGNNSAGSDHFPIFTEISVSPQRSK